MILTIIIVSILFLILFFGVTVAGGKAHDKANAKSLKKHEETRR